jgi:capsular exopolysaccharide synthesis family protein
MERMDKALERVKKRRDANSPESTVGPRDATVNQMRPQLAAEDNFAASARKVLLNTRLMASNRIITDEMDPVALTAYKMLRTRLLQRMRTNGWQSIAVTSSTQGDGKSITAINLALSISGDVNHNVILVDLDLRHSSIASYLGLKLTNGISDCLQRDLPLSEAILNPNVDRLLILPNRTMEKRSSELLSSPIMQDLARELTRDPKSIIIYDMPPVLAADDMLAFAPNVEAVLFVAAEGSTARTDVMKAHELLEDINIIGTILNKSDEKTAAYY